MQSIIFSHIIIYIYEIYHEKFIEAMTKHSVRLKEWNIIKYGALLNGV